jgi:N,N'-diacetyllegionaminate synthase
MNHLKSHTLIIAEAGVNHNGNLNNAFKLIDAAAIAGVDYVKFQTFKSENLVSKNAKKAKYQIRNTKYSSDSQLQMLKKLELSEQDHIQIIKYCEKKSLKFLSTAFDLQSLEYLANLGLDLVKIPSGEITNLPYLELAAKLFKKVILSTGMATIDEIKNALDVFYNNSIQRKDIIILHCNTEYPTPMHDVNLRAMISIQRELGIDIGYSDHTLGIEVPIAAVTLGAKIIEKHFTLDRTMEGPDHAASLEPNELANMVKAIRNIELALCGSGIKEPSKSELKNISIARKSIHLSKNVSKNETITIQHLIMLRPGDGISPMEIHSIIGKKFSNNFEKGHKLNFLDIQ